MQKEVASAGAWDSSMQGAQGPASRQQHRSCVNQQGLLPIPPAPSFSRSR